jgi:phospholipid/cholesterol/gamma-HCH transport system substrate-binding protein
VGRTAIYGSWFNFYLCEYSGQIRVGGEELTIPKQEVGSERCDLP